MASQHSTGHVWASQVASAAAQTHRWGAETWWDGQGLQPLAPVTPGDTGEDVALLVTPRRTHPSGSTPMSILPSTCCRSSCLHGQPSPPSRQYLGSRQRKQLVKYFNFYDTKNSKQGQRFRGNRAKDKYHITDSKQSFLWMQNCYLYSNQYYFFLA